jgi:hypothetical protein
MDLIVVCSLQKWTRYINLANRVSQCGGSISKNKLGYAHGLTRVRVSSPYTALGRGSFLAQRHHPCSPSSSRSDAICTYEPTTAWCSVVVSFPLHCWQEKTDRNRPTPYKYNITVLCLHVLPHCGSSYSGLCDEPDSSLNVSWNQHYIVIYCHIRIKMEDPNLHNLVPKKDSSK